MKKRWLYSLISIMLVFTLIPVNHSATTTEAITTTASTTSNVVNSEPVSRVNAEEKYKWDMTDIYSGRKAFLRDITLLKEELLPQFEQYQGKLDSTKYLVELFTLEEKTSRLLMKSYVYANLLLNLDQTNTEAEEMASLASQVSAQYSNAVAFIQPEILALPKKQIEELRNANQLASYQLFFDQLLMQKEHVLSQKEEKVISLATEMFESPRNIFDKITIADYDEPTINVENNEEVKLSLNNFGQILKSSDRALRKKATEAKYKSYEGINYTLAATYTAEIKKNIFLANVRKFDSALEASLAAEFISKSIYDNLITSVNNNLNYLHKYYDLRKKQLGVEELHNYDLYVPVAEDYQMNIPYEEAVKIIAEALKPLGDKYVADFKKGITNQWVDVYEDENKYTGAFQWGTYDTHPFILMNYNNSLDSVLTLAHEMGHALNSYYSNQEQDYVNAQYPIFTAEVASTLNELLVMDYLINKASTEKEKLYLLNKQIENIRGTVYVQTMYSEFEKEVHEIAEAGKPLSPKVFNDLWLSYLKKYNGDAYTVDDYLKVGWSRIPHFYQNFYVYKYATSMSASYAIFQQLKSKQTDAVAKYLTFLSSGGSDYPVETLKKAGADMTTSKPVDALLVYFGQLIKQFEQNLN